MRRELNHLAVLIVGSLVGCAQPPSVDQCASMNSPSDRLSCLNNAMYGDVLNGAEEGAVVGGILGAGIGYLEGGPRGALIGVAGGAAAGGLAGGAAAYFKYNKERSNGDPQRMYENALADIEAENRQQSELIGAYNDDLDQLNNEITELKNQLKNARQDPAVRIAIQNKTKEVTAEIQTQKEVLDKTIPLQTNIASNSQENFESGPTYSGEWSDDDATLNENNDQLQQISHQYDRAAEDVTKVSFDVENGGSATNSN